MAASSTIPDDPLRSHPVSIFEIARFTISNPLPNEAIPMRRFNHKTIPGTLVLALLLLPVGSVGAVRGEDFSSPQEVNYTKIGPSQTENAGNGKALSVGTLNTLLWP